MIEQIEKLKATKEKLTTEYKANQSEYKSEIKRIDRAVKSFEKGMNELNGTAVKTKSPKSYSEIERILEENGKMHVKQIVKNLNERGIPMHYQSVSGLLQSYAKAGKKFVKVAPATFSLIEPQVDIEIETNNLGGKAGE